MTNLRSTVTGVILAGGRARRMGGGDKGLVTLAGKPMVQHVLDALRPQVRSVIINANRNLDRYHAFGCEVISDVVGDYSGPLAGMTSGMQAAATPYVMCVPCDSPLLANDLVVRMHESLSLESADICVAHDGQRSQPVFLLLRRELVYSMLEFLEQGERKIDKWFSKHRLAISDFSDKPEAFLNVNRPQDAEALERSLRTQQRKR